MTGGEVTLRAWKKVDIDLSEAVTASRAALLAGAADWPIAFVTAADRFEIAALDEEGLKGRGGHVIDEQGVWSVRVFGPRAELRWHQEIAEAPSGVLLTVADQTQAPSSWQALGEAEAFEAPHETTYLLWGRSVGVADGWSTLTSNRIGSLHVPRAVAPLHGAQLVACELWTFDDHGNGWVGEELLTDIRDAGPVGDKGAAGHGE